MAPATRVRTSDHRRARGEVGPRRETGDTELLRTAAPAGCGEVNFSCAIIENGSLSGNVKRGTLFKCFISLEERNGSWAKRLVKPDWQKRGREEWSVDLNIPPSREKCVTQSSSAPWVPPVP